MRFQVFFSLWIVTSWWCIDKIPEATKTKVSKPNKYSLSKLRLPCPPKTARVHAKKAINCSSVDAAMSERRCVFLGESKSALFGLQKVDAIRNHWLRLFTTEWMNEWCTYIVLYSVLLYTQSTSQSCGGGGGVSLTTTSVQHPLGWCDGCHRTTAAPVRSPHTSYRWRGERES